MSIIEFLIYLTIAGVTGSVAQSLVGFERGGCLSAVFTGLIGAVMGSWLASKFGFEELLSLKIGSQNFPVVWSVIGASLFVGVLALLTSGRRRRSGFREE